MRKRTIFQHILVIVFLFACTKESVNPKEEIDEPNLKYRYAYHLEGPDNESISINFGIWMFKPQEVEFSAIAHWLGWPHEGKTILEPINVLWVDFQATDVTQARTNIVEFLKNNDFNSRMGSSEGYSGLFEDEWISQYERTWSDNTMPIVKNNHARIFSAFEVLSDKNEPVFITSGAFSRESTTHKYISFNQAREAMTEYGNWVVQEEKLNAGNIFDNENYSTDDHDGVKVFVLYDKKNKFARTSNNFSWNTSDFNCKCEEEFGSGFRMADWSEVKNYIAQNSYSDFFLMTGMENYRSNGWVTVGGQHLYSSNRHYFIERHDGNIPGGWLVHAQIGNNIIDLGSWYNSRSILCYK